MAHRFNVLVHSHQHCSQMQQAAVFSKKSPTVHYLPSTKQHEEKVSNYLVNIVEFLAAKGPDIILRSWWRSGQIRFLAT